jgi:hypothetical protein
MGIVAAAADAIEEKRCQTVLGLASALRKRKGTIMPILSEDIGLVNPW